ncbi:DNA internalization-related competence protein ComEC/Rec2 [Haloplasma contractile]|uniref:DNA internalization-related competence protein ComEC-Rec2 n=1 Tax=Haloplasma contractile SSD-17B TaxID=1033810 RepID=U2FRZ0_9MOLU|nr:DNA internalization-related competence protein ComEC/Rec2 [Haloplasma contractile]ERJ13734.1 DNA internalization-related competence protein ComEC-Rec2 [Haloplasma contractile SSD-17B]
MIGFQKAFFYLAISVTLSLLLIKDYHLLYVIIGLIYSFFLYRKNKYLLIVALLISMLMVVNYYVQYNYYINSNQFNGESIQLTCVIDSFFEKTEYTYNVTCKKNNKRYLLKIELTTIKDETVLQLGNTIKLKAITSIPKHNTTPHVFNYHSYLTSKKISALLYVDELRVENSYMTHLQAIKYKLYLHLNRIKSNKAYGFAILFGDRSYFDDHYNKEIESLNISYLFAISGLHIGLIVTVFFELLRRCKLNQTIIQIILTVILMMYCYLTNFSPSIMRASLFVLALFIKQKFLFSIHNLNVLSLIYLVLLIINPFSLLNIGFVLSFLITFVFIISGELLSNDQNNRFKSVFIVNLLAQLFSLPIIASMNYTYNFLSIITNIPLSILYVFFILPSSFMIVIIPSSTYFLNPIFVGYESLVSFFSSIDWFLVNIGSFTLIRSVFYYSLLYFIVCNLENQKSIIKLSILLLIVMFSWNQFKIQDEIVFFDVGQGDSILLHSSFNRCTTLVDTGGKVTYTNKISHPSLYSVIPYLESQSINTVDYLFISHGDTDHAGDYALFFKNFYVKHVVLSQYDQSKLKKEIVAVAKQDGSNIILIDQEKSIQCGNFLFTIVSPNKQYGNDNDNSLVIKTTLESQIVLLTGDISKQVENNLIDSGLLNDISILKVAHHGSNTSTSLSFLEHVDAEIGVISVGKNNYGHPSADVLNRLERTKTQYYRTDQDGTIRISYYFKKYRIIETFPPYNNK